LRSLSSSLNYTWDNLLKTTNRNSYSWQIKIFVLSLPVTLSQETRTGDEVEVGVLVGVKILVENEVLVEVVLVGFEVLEVLVVVCEVVEVDVVGATVTLVEVGTLDVAIYVRTINACIYYLMPISRSTIITNTSLMLQTVTSYLCVP